MGEKVNISREDVLNIIDSNKHCSVEVHWEDANHCWYVTVLCVKEGMRVTFAIHKQSHIGPVCLTGAAKADAYIMLKNSPHTPCFLEDL